MALAGSVLRQQDRPRAQPADGAVSHLDFHRARKVDHELPARRVVIVQVVITVDFPEDHYNPKLAGHEVRFQVKVADLEEKVLPELNDEFAKDLGQELESLDQLKDRIREDLVAAENRRVDSQLRNQLVDKLLEMVDFEVPEAMVGREIDAMVNNTQFNLKRSGLDLEATPTMRP